MEVRLGKNRDTNPAIAVGEVRQRDHVNGKDQQQRKNKE
jgi:hypothetical protein